MHNQLILYTAKGVLLEATQPCMQLLLQLSSCHCLTSNASDASPQGLDCSATMNLNVLPLRVWCAILTQVLVGLGMVADPSNCAATCVDNREIAAANEREEVTPAQVQAMGVPFARCLLGSVETLIQTVLTAAVARSPVPILFVSLKPTHPRCQNPLTTLGFLHNQRPSSRGWQPLTQSLSD
jgi:hypothetical protein